MGIPAVIMSVEAWWSYVSQWKNIFWSLFISLHLPCRKTAKSKKQSKGMETNVAELLKQSRQLSSEKMRLHDEYKDGCIDRELYKQKR